MPSKFRLRYIFKPFTNLLAKGFIKIGIQNPNIITIFMILLAILSAISLLFLKNLLIFAIFVFWVGIFDGIDGQVARLTNRASSLGGFF
ncbi:MAG: CDP-alcohol phosphatidyltransferase family protein, partial [Candidatus Hodarchaeota archaeon]